MSPGLFAKFHEATGIDPPTVRDTNDPAFQATSTLPKLVSQAEQPHGWRRSRRWATHAAPTTCRESVFDVQVVANDFVAEPEHPAFGPYTTSGMPLRMEKARCEIRSAVHGWQSTRWKS